MGFDFRSFFGASPKKTIGAAVFRDKINQTLLGHGTKHTKKRDKITFAGTVSTDKKIELPKLKIFQFSDRFKAEKG